MSESKEDLSPKPDWAKDPRLAEVVTLLRRSMRFEEQETVDRTSCFGLFTLPNEGDCDQAPTCDLSKWCKQAYQMHQVSIAQNVRLPPRPVKPLQPSLNPTVLVSPDEPKQMLTEPAAERTLARKTQERNKWAGTDKFLRKGYTPCGRHVDALLAEFLANLPKFPELPLIWHAQKFEEKFGHLGHFTLAATASYHAIHRDAVVLCRFWTNTVKQAIVDILGELVAPLKKASEKLGTYRYLDRDVLQLEPPFPTPRASWMKVRPCKHRVIVRTPEASKAVAQAIRAYWRF